MSVQVSLTEGMGFVHPPLNARYAKHHAHGVSQHMPPASIAGSAAL